MLNGFLIGAKKAKIDVVLSIILIGLIIITFAIYGWKAGLIAIVITFVSAVISRPFAAKAAYKLLANGPEYIENFLCFLQRHWPKRGKS
jgi:hypothetical protein